MDRADEIARLAGSLLATHGRVHIRSSVSRMVRVAVAARQLGIDLTGATMMGGAEPPTPAKVAEIRASGAEFTSAYHFSEVGMAGSRCLTSADPNDQHLMRDHLALIQAPRTVPGFDVEVPAFCFTTLLPTASKLLINVESDDYGIVDERPCGCPWGALGFTTHVRDIRSFRKLSGEGVTLIGTDIERILGEVLPRVHGGSAVDYQLLEEEGDRGQTHVTLLVDPSVALDDEQGPAATFLAEIEAMGTRAGLTHALWQQAGTLRVRRAVPHWTARGKMLPLHLSRRTMT
jgi:phenylacetate-coenzyme A ligase PaaK-like adenylate-forming protein